MIRRIAAIDVFTISVELNLSSLSDSWRKDTEGMQKGLLQDAEKGSISIRNLIDSEKAKDEIDAFYSIQWCLRPNHLNTILFEAEYAL